MEASFESMTKIRRVKKYVLLSKIPIKARLLYKKNTQKRFNKFLKTNLRRFKTKQMNKMKYKMLNLRP